MTTRVLLFTLIGSAFALDPPIFEISLEHAKTGRLTPYQLCYGRRIENPKSKKEKDFKTRIFAINIKEGQSCRGLGGDARWSMIGVTDPKNSYSRKYAIDEWFSNDYGNQLDDRSYYLTAPYNEVSYEEKDQADKTEPAMIQDIVKLADRGKSMTLGKPITRYQSPEVKDRNIPAIWHIIRREQFPSIKITDKTQVKVGDLLELLQSPILSDNDADDGPYPETDNRLYLYMTGDDENYGEKEGGKYTNDFPPLGGKVNLLRGHDVIMTRYFMEVKLRIGNPVELLDWIKTRPPITDDVPMKMVQSDREDTDPREAFLAQMEAADAERKAKKKPESGSGLGFGFGLVNKMAKNIKKGIQNKAASLTAKLSDKISSTVKTGLEGIARKPKYAEESKEAGGPTSDDDDDEYNQIPEQKVTWLTDEVDPFGTLQGSNNQIPETMEQIPENL